MRNLKKKDSSILDGYQIYCTPAEMCGVMIEEDNKWKTLIENASRQN
jgi:hypothetical protein